MLLNFKDVAVMVLARFLPKIAPKPEYMRGYLFYQRVAPTGLNGKFFLSLKKSRQNLCNTGHLTRHYHTGLLTCRPNGA